MLAPGLKKLRETASAVFHGQIPGWLELRYRDAASHMLRWWRLLMTNTRMLVLFLLLFLGQPVYYFWLELIPLNLLFVYLLMRQEKMAESLLQLVAKAGRDNENALSAHGSPRPRKGEGECGGIPLLSDMGFVRFLRFCGQGLSEIERKSPYAKQQQQILPAV